VVMLLLFALCFVMLYRRSRGAAVIFIVSALLTHIWFVCTTLEYMTVYIIMLSVLPLYLRFSDKPSALVVLSCAAGTVTAFADFLTTEIMTLFVPLVAVLLVKRYDDKKSAVLTAGCSVSWLGGYILTFIVRWAAASAVTGRGITDIALSSAGERIGGLPDGIGSHAELFFSSLGANLSMLTLTDSKTDISGTVLWIFIFAAVCIFIGARTNKRRAVPMVLLFIAAVPLVRFGVLMNHSFLHNYFTYRSLMISIMAVLGFAWFKE
ncbi:MAG: hypothetical protein ILP19_05120, partial [Oscillospiraceae bacterium]|nr:hypothetical protein [Oscillospiraceae bacterium]